MTKLNWEKTRLQSRSYKYGLEIDPRVGVDPNKIPKYRSSTKCAKKRSAISNSQPDSLIKHTITHKTVCRTREEETIHILSELNSFTRRLKSITFCVSKNFRKVCINTYNSYKQKLINLKNNDETQCVISNAKAALDEMCKRHESSKQPKKKPSGTTMQPKSPPEDSVPIR